MATNALAPLLFGWLFDRIGLGILMVVSLLSALFARAIHVIAERVSWLWP